MTDDLRDELRQKLAEWWAVDAPTTATIAAANDADLVALLDTFCILHSLFRDQKVEREFVREKQETLGARTPLELFAAGEFQRAHTFVRECGNC